MLWHGGDPAGWNRHESLGIRFKSSVAGEIEDLLELLLRTHLSNVTTTNLASCQAPTVPQTTETTETDKMTSSGIQPGVLTIYVNTQTDKKQMTLESNKLTIKARTNPDKATNKQT